MTFYMGSQESGITLSPKASFVLGLVGGILVLCTIGFFILLGLMLGGEAEATVKPAVNKPAAVAPSPQPAAPADEGVGEVKPIGADEYSIGPDDAPVTIITYTDIECPFCGRFHPSFEQALEDFDGQIQATIRHFPLSFHQQARPAANAAECAGEQGEYFEFISELFSNQQNLSDDFYEEVAADLGLNVGKFNDCVSSQKYDAKVTADMNSGLAAGVKGTPGTIIVGPNSEPQLVPGAVPYEQFKAMIEAAL